MFFPGEESELFLVSQSVSARLSGSEGPNILPWSHSFSILMTIIHILWFRLTRILLLQIGYQQYALHSRDYSILKPWNLQKTQIVAAPSTSLLIANPPAVPIVSSARMTVTEFCYSHSLDLLISPF